MMERSDLPLVRLRALEPEDLDLLYTIENDENLWDVSNTCVPLSKYMLKRYLAVQSQDIFQSGQLRLVIEEVSTAKAVGLVDLTDISFLDGRAEVGIALLRAERGKRLGQAALLALAQYAKKKLRLRLLFSQIAVPQNQVSINLFESVEYEQIALLPAWHYCNGVYEDIAVYQKML